MNMKKLYHITVFFMRNAEFKTFAVNNLIKVI